jgi:Legionella pneumophila major outer membrane protein precursor
VYQFIFCVLALLSPHLWAETRLTQGQSEIVSTACEQNYWELAGHGLYIQAISSLSTRPTYTNGNQASEFHLGDKLPWSWGFQFEMAYDYHTGNDLNLNWYHYRGNSTDVLSSPVSFNQLLIAVPFSSNPSAYDHFTIKAASLEIHPQWDQVNIEFAKKVHLGESDDLRLHGGVNYSRLASTGLETVQGSSRLDTTITEYQNTDEFSALYSGFGIRSGMDLTHDFNNGLAIFAKGAVSILAGMSQSRHELNDIINGIAYQGLNQLNRPRVVPELDGRVGVDYTYEFVQGDLHAEVAWLWVNYFQAFSHPDSNFGVQGLFLGLHCMGNLL